MSHLSKIFEEAPIKVQNRNGFDLSHIHAGTSKTGQLVPVLTKLLPPNSTISLGVQAEVSLPPLVAPFYGKVDFAIEGFIVPCSILYGGWKQFISNQQDTMFPANQDFISTSGATVVSSNTDNSWGKTGYALPYFPLMKVSLYNIASFRSLYATNDNIYDYMGMAFRTVPNFSTGAVDLNVSLLPALAYHKICDVFYRNTKLTKTWFGVNPNVGFPATTALTLNAQEQKASSYNCKNVSLIWHSFYTNGALGSAGGISENDSDALFDTAASLTFPDSVSLFSSRQRTYNRDYFTSAVPSPQQGGAATLQFSVDTGTSDGSFTINALRMANSLQKFLETNNLSGDYAETMRNRWGVRPIDADFDEPHYLGRVVVPVYQHTVSKQDALESSYDTQLANQPNIFAGSGILGAEASKGKANGEGSICDNFNVSTWSYLMVLASLYPHANYNYGINRELTMTKLGDFPAPELQSVGMEEIKNYEISSYATDFSEASKWFSTFGYIPRYSRFKYMDDFVSGELRPNKTLKQYQIQRDFGTTMPELGTNFVTISQNALDNVLSVSTVEMSLTCWWEIFFNFKVVMPLADFCIPTLGELGDTHTIKTTVGGSRL